MPAVAIDSNVLLAARNENAERHGTARGIVRRIDRGELPRARVVTYVLPEVLHPLQKRFRKEVAVETLEWLRESRGFTIVHVAKGTHSDGERLYRLHEAGGPEWVDALIAAYMSEAGLEYVYSFDDDLDSFDGITRLTDPDDPFEP